MQMRLAISVFLVFFLQTGQMALAQLPVTLLFRLAAGAVEEQSRQYEPRTEAQKILSNGYVFNSVPRNPGQSFVVVSNDSQFLQSQPYEKLISADNLLYGMPIFLRSDALAGVPADVYQFINDQCSGDGWASVQFVGQAGAQDLLGITCGAVSANQKSVAAIAQPVPRLPGAYDGAAKSQSFEYLVASLDNFELSSFGSIKCAISLQNKDVSRGAGVALFALFSDGIADFWKFFPKSDASISDNAGNNYSATQVDGLGFAREQSDWTILKPGQAMTITFHFPSGPLRPGTSYNFRFSLRIAHYPQGARAESDLQLSRFTVQMSDIRPLR